MKKVALIGGAGYVGTSLVPILLEKNYKVRVVDNLMFGGNQLLPFFKNDNFEFFKGDIRDLESMKMAVEGCDVIIPLAAIVGYPACRKNPQLAEETNVGGAKNIIEVTPKDKLIIYPSTGSNYGAVEEICTEETPLNPLSLYGQTKTIAENLFMNRGNCVVYRYATAFGASPRMRLDLLINDFTYKAVTENYLVIYEKHFMRTFIHVRDMASSVLFAIEHNSKMIDNIYNVGSDKMNYSKHDVCEILKSKIDSLYVHYADVGEDIDKRNYVVSYDKINDLGFQTTVTVEEGIDELKNCYKVLDFQRAYSNVEY